MFYFCVIFCNLGDISCLIGVDYKTITTVLIN